MTIPTCPKCNTKSSKESIRDIARGDGDYGYFHRCLDWNILPEKYHKLKSYMCTNPKCFNDFFHFNLAEYKIPLVKKIPPPNLKKKKKSKKKKKIEKKSTPPKKKNQNHYFL